MGDRPFASSCQAPMGSRTLIAWVATSYAPRFHAAHTVLHPRPENTT